MPSPPTDRELAILRRVLRAETVAGVEQLVDQLRMIQVAPVSDSTCRVYLVHPDAPRSPFARDDRRTLPTRFPVRTPSGRVAGEIAVWVQQGHLCALQYVSHGSTDAMVLPDPEWVQVPTQVPGEVLVRAARQALAGVQAVGTDPTPPPAPAAPAPAVPAAAPTRATGEGRRRLHPLLAALALLVGALAVAAFMAAFARGADVESARSAGLAAGAAQGAEHGEVAGRFAGDLEGRVAGRNLAYPPAFVAARARERAVMRRDAAERRRAAAAAASASTAATARAPVLAPTPVADNTSCAGFRDARGYWICT